MSDLNKSLRIEVVGPPRYRVESAIEVKVENMAANPIAMAADLGNRLFLLEDGKWRPVSNAVRYHGGDFVLDPAGVGVLTSDVPTLVLPVLNGSVAASGGQSLRIYVQGKLRPAGGEVPVGACVDVTLAP